MSRLIDADVLMEILTTAIRNMKGMAKFLDAENDPEIQMEIKAYTDIANGVKDMPTIDPQHKPGRWTHAWGTDDGIWKCSKCGFEINAHGCVDPVEYLETYKFCPNCGSDNREEGDTP